MTRSPVFPLCCFFLCFRLRSVGTSTGTSQPVGSLPYQDLSLSKCWAAGVRGGGPRTRRMEWWGVVGKPPR
ncbi:hypothetical protein QBC33DRAFT_543331 [Phialemonium atrogriseum]|uniref:Secreted protein n=1 Tax=Phialemonium atrogriseum TaxID=1093897 RepID=A0AAJ0BYT0_9PEZI|nr:uncharacterized protein QBC33DRAFT_543331 [Phialemonium atrogriseum]KAK1765604.1 hypothetical protein QBC33DRAFT_543331 [Phialemonium atrogriseum]